MADIDAELLALAGGETSSDEDVPKQSPKRSPSPSSAPPSPGKPKTMVKAGVARKKAAKPARRVVRKTKREDSEEEGEASSIPSSPNSLQSASMSESESDTSPINGGDDEDETPTYPIENKYRSLEDKARILAMSEIEREAELAKRAEEVEREQQDRHLRLLLQSRGKETGKKKRKAGSADLDEHQRKSSRQKTTLGGRKVGETSGALEAYKRSREQRGLDNQSRRAGSGKARTKKSSQDEDYSDADAEGESELEWDEGARPAPKNEPAGEFRDFERVRVSRTNFAKFCFYPGFNEAVTGCFTRVSVGVDRTTDTSIYRMGQIKGFKEGKPYALEGANGKFFPVDMYAVLAIGKDEKEMPFIAVSNSAFTEAEFERYRKTLLAQNVPLSTKPFLSSKINDINSLINRSWTEEELQEKLRRSGVLQARVAHIERAEINNRRKEAVEKGDEAEIAKCDVELAALDGPAKLAYGTALQHSPKPAAPKGLSQQERLAALNRANRKANAEEIRRAQIAEKRAEKRAQAAIARGEAVANPFQRVKTRAKIHHNANPDSLVPAATHGADDLFTDISDNSRAVTPAAGANATGTNTPKITASGTSTPLVANGKANGQKKGGWSSFSRPENDDDIIASMDLGIDIEI